MDGGRGGLLRSRLCFCMSNTMHLMRLLRVSIFEYSCTVVLLSHIEFSSRIQNSFRTTTVAPACDLGGAPRCP